MRFHPTRIPAVRRVLMAAVAKLRPEILSTRHGFDLWMPRDDRSPYVLSLFLEGTYEPAETELIKNLVQPGDVVFDIGANVGYMTMLMANAVSRGEGGQVHSFEPSARHFRTLVRNVELNGMERIVRPVNDAMGSADGNQRLYLSADNYGDHTLVAVPGRQRETVTMCVFDSYRKQACPDRRVRLVKIDVQGYELEVISGMRASLAQALVDHVILEVWPIRIKATGRSAAELGDLMDSLPYEVRVISNTSDIPVESIDDLVGKTSRLEKDPHAFLNLLLSRTELGALA